MTSFIYSTCLRFNKILFFVLFASLLLSARSADASLQFGPGGEFSNGVTTLSGTVTVDFIDTATGVDIKIDTNGLVAAATEKITGLYLNFDESFGGTLISSEFSHASTIVNNDRASAGAGFKADGDGYFNILLSWSSSAALLADTIQTISVTDSMLDAADFLNQLSVNGPVGKNGFEATLRVQSIPNGAGSGFFAPVSAIPEPTTFLVWSMLGITGTSLLRRKHHF